jgi:outer membrane protein OmpA-like peptidoglycan-associated protein
MAERLMDVPMRIFGLAPLVALLFLSAPAFAQDYGGPLEADIVIQRFTPVTGAHGIFTVDGSRSQTHGQVAGGIMLNFSRKPLVLELPNSPQPIAIVEDQLVGDLLFNIGLFDLFEVGLSVPVYGINSASIQERPIEGLTLGDVRLRPKYTVFDRDDVPVGVALVTHVTLPTGDDTAFTSSGAVSVRPGVIADVGDDDFLVAVNLLFDLQETRDFGSLKVDNEFLYGLGMNWQFVDGLYLGTEVFGSTSFNNAFVEENSPVEALVGLEYRDPWGFRYTVGTGTGLVAGYGAPEYRVFGGIRFAQDVRDTDGDGLFDDVDQCIKEPEDKDGFEDQDGCPDLDNDQDGILDTVDECPLDPEDVDGFEDEDGCPDPDNDGDGLLDVQDECPMVPGPKKNNGCPIVDSDGDGLFDDVDKCPQQPEDKDGFEDEDGCPDPDNDRDGVLDIADKCPDKPETINGFEDDDGCPDKGKPKVIVMAKEIKILERVYFDTGKASIKDRSHSLLDQVALALRANPQIEGVEVQGHTDDRGSDNYNLQLSDDRAKSVRAYLLGKGIAEDRLTARGYGETDPAVAIEGLKRRALANARERNRRVEFLITSQAPVEVEVTE